MKRYLFNILVALDQLVNVVVADGEPDETLSSNAYRMHRDGKPCGFFAPLIDNLFFWQIRHCKSAFIAERERAQLPPEFRR